MGEVNEWRRQHVRQRGQGLLEAGGVRIGCGVWFVVWRKKVRKEIGEVVVCGKRRSEGGEVGGKGEGGGGVAGGRREGGERSI